MSYYPTQYNWAINGLGSYYPTQYNWAINGLGQACPDCSFWTGSACLPCPDGSTMLECEGCVGGRPIPEKPSFMKEYGPQILLAVISAAAVAVAVPPLLGMFGKSM